MSCWNKCDTELACNAISFCTDGSEEICNDYNCLLFPNKELRQHKNLKFVSKMRKSESNLSIYL